MALVSLDDILAFSEIQTRLLSVFADMYPNYQENFFSTVPARGNLIVNGDKWIFTKHGLGVKFENHRTGCVIDAHKFYDNVNNAIDAWRILQFFESMGTSSITEQAIDDSLMAQVKSGILKATNHRGVYGVNS